MACFTPRYLACFTLYPCARFRCFSENDAKLCCGACLGLSARYTRQPFRADYPSVPLSPAFFYHYRATSTAHFFIPLYARYRHTLRTYLPTLFLQRELRYRLSLASPDLLPFFLCGVHCARTIPFPFTIPAIYFLLYYLLLSDYGFCGFTACVGELCHFLCALLTPNITIALPQTFYVCRQLACMGVVWRLPVSLQLFQFYVTVVSYLPLTGTFLLFAAGTPLPPFSPSALLSCPRLLNYSSWHGGPLDTLLSMPCSHFVCIFFLYSHSLFSFPYHSVLPTPSSWRQENTV